jgi:predicted CopG family antitoxin
MMPSNKKKKEIPSPIVNELYERKHTRIDILVLPGCMGLRRGNDRNKEKEAMKGRKKINRHR